MELTIHLRATKKVKKMKKWKKKNKKKQKKTKATRGNLQKELRVAYVFDSFSIGKKSGKNRGPRRNSYPLAMGWSSGLE